MSATAGGELPACSADPFRDACALSDPHAGRSASKPTRRIGEIQLRYGTVRMRMGLLPKIHSDFVEWIWHDFRIRVRLRRGIGRRNNADIGKRIASRFLWDIVGCQDLFHRIVGIGFLSPIHDDVRQPNDQKHSAQAEQADLQAMNGLRPELALGRWNVVLRRRDLLRNSFRFEIGHGGPYAISAFKPGKDGQSLGLEPFGIVDRG